MIELRDLNRVYVSTDVETVALRDVNLKVAEGEFVSVQGSSGCGKSTLLNTLGLIDQPTSGQYLFAGQHVENRRENDLVRFRRENIGCVFQSFNLLEDLTVEENVALPLRYCGVKGRRAKTRIREALELVGLAHRTTHRPNQLSGGQQQRVAVARAIITDPKLILADEPTGNLDSINGEKIMELIKLLNEQGTTVIMVTHSERDAARAGRAIHMFDGQIVSDSSEEASL
ncbi:MAG: ABC transporter ATP-binding protein [Myxococcota bacterium]